LEEAFGELDKQTKGKVELKAKNTSLEEELGKLFKS
jgi:hypothetical protein